MDAVSEIRCLPSSHFTANIKEIKDQKNGTLLKLSDDSNAPWKMFIDKLNKSDCIYLRHQNYFAFVVEKTGSDLLLRILNCSGLNVGSAVHLSYIAALCKIIRVIGFVNSMLYDI